MSNPNRPPEADLPQAVPITSIFETFSFTTGTTRILMDNGVSPSQLRQFVNRPIPEAFFRDRIIDPNLYTSQQFETDSLYFLLSGQLEIQYTATSEIQRVSSAFYDSSSWVAYRTFWEENQDCSITPSPIFNLVRIKKRINSTLSPEYNNFSNLNILVKKLENSTEVINAANNTSLFVVNNGNDFVVQSGGETFDLSQRPSSSNLTFQNGGLDSYFYDQEKIFKFLVSGVTNVSTSNSVYLILLSPKS